jgi:hypothetical protein
MIPNLAITSGQRRLGAGIRIRCIVSDSGGRPFEDDEEEEDREEEGRHEGKERGK